MVTEHFSVKECCWLPTWEILHDATPEEQANLIMTCELLEKVHALFGPVHVHCMIRPDEYNEVVGGAPDSAHIKGLAVDFDVEGVKCDIIRRALMQKIEPWNCRMENRPGSDWVHLDLAPVPPGGHRFFIP
jgi:uncharacterized protein YcbK (DUF882 family)